MAGWISDLRTSIRSLSKSPWFAALVVVTLGLGIGANTTMFSIVRGVLLRPLPYRDAGRLMVANLSLPDFEDVRDSSRSFDRVAVWASNFYNLSSTAGESEQVRGALVSTDFFPLLSEAALGRTFLPEDARAPVAVISDALWRSRFEADPKVLGRSLDLSGKTYTIVGVMPPAFEYPASDFGETVLLVRSAAGASLPWADVHGAFRSLDRGLPLFRTHTLAESIEGQLQDRRQGTLVISLFGAMALALATAGLYSVVSYSVARRAREIGIRVALGASHRTVTSLFLRRGAKLAAAGVAVGLLLSAGLTRLLTRMLFGIEATDALTFAAVAAILAGVAVAASRIPARRAARVDPIRVLRAD